MLPRIRLLLLPLLCFVLFAQQGDSLRPAVFPNLNAENLAKTKLNLPSDFAGKANLLLIYFEPEQAKVVDTWMPFAQALQHMNFNFRYYKMPVSNPENLIFRWWDTSSLRSVEADPETWPWIIPLYTNKQDFRRALEIPNEKDIVAVLVNKSGQVLWRSSGKFTDDKKGPLSAAVAAATR
ncbi:MAG TPA: hypothetical protein VFA02_01090 [Pseudacidobacterium sp.]|nr:hypothetical protein [Pseudacidobacterium sp.]